MAIREHGYVVLPLMGCCAGKSKVHIISGERLAVYDPSRDPRSDLKGVIGAGSFWLQLPASPLCFTSN